MASEEPTVAVEPVAEPEAAEPAEENPAPKAAKTKKAKEPKAKKPAGAKKPRSPPTHPPYIEVTDLRIWIRLVSFWIVSMVWIWILFWEL